MSDIIVGGESQHILLSGGEKFVVETPMLGKIYSMAVDGYLFAKDVEEFVAGGKYLLIKGEVIVPVVKVDVGDVEVTR